MFFNSVLSNCSLRRNWSNNRDILCKGSPGFQQLITFHTVLIVQLLPWVGHSCNYMDWSPQGSSVGFLRQEYWSGLPFPFNNLEDTESFGKEYVSVYSWVEIILLKLMLQEWDCLCHWCGLWLDNKPGDETPIFVVTLCLSVLLLSFGTWTFPSYCGMLWTHGNVYILIWGQRSIFKPACPFYKGKILLFFQSCGRLMIETNS